MLNLAAMTKDEQEQYFNQLIQKLKAEQEKKLVQQQKFVNSTPGFSTDKAKKAGAFYFYETATVAFGKSEFVNIWGNRPLEDNWRWSKKTLTNVAQNDATAEATTEKASQVILQLSTILIKFQMTQKIDSIAKERNFAYYQLGLIYKNKFKDYERSK